VDVKISMYRERAFEERVQRIKDGGSDKRLVEMSQ
jgi:hypothetical protein